ncbi:hypothetical protein [Microcoleus sp. Pol12B5]|uniref:hypothetical protein n=1 Tax=Microcoleus sp. Pol12B5 TaxID=3055396 RepID=UPI002FD070FE
MLCKTPIVFDDEYSAMKIPNRATANETRSPNYKGTPFSLGISHLTQEAIDTHYSGSIAS